MKVQILFLIVIVIQVVSIAQVEAQTTKEDYQCPTNYTWVPADFSVGTKGGFCVAQFEMKQEDAPVAKPEGRPWVNVVQEKARLACESLGRGYHLIRNEEWMTIARNIEKQPSNWSGHAVGVGRLNQGHSDSVPMRVLEVLNVNDPYSGTETTEQEDWAQKRTHTLSTGGIIWDFAGNAWEWVDWNMAHGKANPQWQWAEINSAAPTFSMPTSTFKSFDENMNSAQGIGLYYSGPEGSGGAVLRGGGFFNNEESGIYTLFLNNSPVVTDESIGFRCTYTKK